MALSKNIMRNVARFRIRGHGLKCKLVYMAGVRTGVHVFAICVKTGIFKMRSTSFFHVSVPNIYGTSSSTYSIIFLKVTSKVLYFFITHH
jgi:hypothetical protein